MSAWGSLLVFLSVGTGFWVLLDDSWSPLLKVVLAVHPVVALVATAWVLWFTIQNLRAERGLRSWWNLGVIPGAIAAAFTLSVGLLPTWMDSTAWLVFGGLVMVASVLLRLRQALETGDGSAGDRRASLTGILIWGIWLPVAATGWIPLLFFQDRNIVNVMAVHRWSAYALVAIYLLHLLVLRRGRVREPGGSVLGRRPARLGLTLTCAGLGIAAVVAWLGPSATWTLPLNTVPMERRPASEQAWPPTSPVATADLDRLDVTAGCGNTDGCHKEILEEHLRSIHNVTLRPQYFQKNLEDMATEVGARNQIICAGCHYPVATLDTRKDVDYYKTRNTFSCVFCHSIQDAGLDPEDRRRSWLEVSPPWGHLGLFPGDDGKVDETDRLLIRLNAAGHRRAFKKPFHSEDAFCTACHHLQMPVVTAPGLLNPTCIRCHMQPQRVYGGPTDKKSHLFAGSNVGPFTLTGDDQTADVVRRWAEGRIVPSLDGWETLWKVRPTLDTPIEKVPWIMVTFYYNVPPQPGRPFTLHVVTTNTGLGHAFPAGSLDLARAWLDVTVRDEQDRVICSQGQATPGGPVPQDTPNLGGHMIGLDGQVITRNRVWQVQNKVYERQIANKVEITDPVVCAIPPDSTKEIRVVARWIYRKLDQDFLDYAYGKGVRVSPDVVPGEAAATIPIDTTGTVYPPDVGY